MSIKNIVPCEFCQKNADFFGTHLLNNNKFDTLERLKGQLLYRNPLQNSQQFKDWVVDNGKIRFHNNALLMESPDAQSEDVNTGHVTVWCDAVFPGILEFEFKVIRPDLCIVFFCAKGQDGMDMFSSAMPKRLGEFFHYIKGKILSYHISYHALGRGRANLRKNNKFFLLSTGIIDDVDTDYHLLTLIKNKDNISCFVDKVQIIEYKDNDEERYGKYYGSGRIELRQMKKAICEYRNFNVWEINHQTN